MKTVTLYSALFLLGMAGCRYDAADDLFPPATDACATVVTYKDVVKPMLNKNCGNCHSGGAPSAGVRFDTHADTKKVASSGKLLGVVKHSPGFDPMPLGGGKLSDCNIGQLEKWIQDGMPDN